MVTLLHLSDLHFGAERPSVMLALDTLAQQLAPDMVVVSGDLTQRARPRQFAQARRFLAGLPAPQLLVPGNHDIPLFNLWARWRDPFRGFRLTFGAPDCREAAVPEVLALGINSASPRHRVNGVMDARQLAWVRQRLRESPPEQLRVVAIHHPLGMPEGAAHHDLLVDHQQFFAAQEVHQADIVLAGHNHYPGACALGAPHGQAPGVWSVLAGSAMSHRQRAGQPNSVNVLRYQPQARQRTCTLERWDYDEQAGGFRQVDATVLPLRDAG